jgi:hypothetical protein
VINFRYHVVSLVAVFLALAVGVVMGYGILGQPTVKTLQNRVDSVRDHLNETRAENDQLRSSLDRANSTLDAFSSFGVTDRLPNVSVIVLAVRDVSSDVAQQSVTLAQQARADAPGILWLEPKWALRGDGDPDALSKALGIPSRRKSPLREQGYRALARRLAEGPPPAGSEDLLENLVTQGFVSAEGVGSDDATVDIEGVGGPATRVLLVDRTGSSELPKSVVSPFSLAAADVKLPLVVGESYDEDQGVDRGSLLDPVLKNDALAQVVSTVDDVELVEGRIAAVLALADLGRNVVGHYGFGSGATGSAPKWWQP